MFLVLPRDDDEFSSNFFSPNKLKAHTNWTVIRLVFKKGVVSKNGIKINEGMLNEGTLYGKLSTFLRTLVIPKIRTMQMDKRILG